MEASEEDEKEGEIECATPLPTMVNKDLRRDLFPSNEPTTHKTLVQKPRFPSDDELEDVVNDHEDTGKGEDHDDPDNSHELQISTSYKSSNGP